MQLGQAKAIGVLDQHHAGLGHIHPHLHHRGTHQHLGVAAGKGPNRRLLLCAGQTTMQQADVQLRKHLITQLPIDHRHGAQIQLLRFLHQR